MAFQNLYSATCGHVESDDAFDGAIYMRYRGCHTMHFAAFVMRVCVLSCLCAGNMTRQTLAEWSVSSLETAEIVENCQLVIIEFEAINYTYCDLVGSLPWSCCIVTVLFLKLALRLVYCHQ